VNHTFVVGGRQPAAGLDDDAHALGRVQWPALLQPVPQAIALEQLEGDPWIAAVVRARLEQLDHVGVVDPDLRLALEALEVVPRFGAVRADDLHGRRGSVGAHRPVDDAHAALAEDALDAEGAHLAGVAVGTLFRFRQGRVWALEGPPS